MTAHVAGVRAGLATAERGPRLSLLHVLVALPLATAGFANLAARWRVGPLSGMGAETVLESALVIAGVVIAARWPRRLLALTASFSAFLVWAVVRSLATPPTFEGAQNALVYVLFFGGVVLAGTLVARDPRAAVAWITRSLTLLQTVALSVAAVNLAAYGFAREGSWFVGGRSLALVLLIAMNWQLARWAAGRPRALLLALTCFAGVLATGSRASSAIALLSFGVVVAALASHRPRRAMIGFAVLSVALGASAALIAFEPVYHARFFGGDARLRVLGYAVNVSGRAAFWQVMVRSAMERPVVGHGLGSSQRVMAAEFLESDNIRHPHNDYLRVWHDLGVVGTTLMLGSLLLWLAVLFRGWRRAERTNAAARPLQLAALLILVELLLGMVTDNVLIYPFFMGAAGVVIGTGIGLTCVRPARALSVSHGSTA